MRGSSLRTKPVPFAAKNIAESVLAMYCLNEAGRLKALCVFDSSDQIPAFQKVFER